VELSIDGHGPSHRPLTWGRLLALTLEQAMEAPATDSGILLLQVQHLFEKRQAELIAGMVRRSTAVVFESLKPLALKGIENPIDVGARELEAIGNALFIPALRRHAHDSPARLIGIIIRGKRGEIEFQLNRGVIRDQKPFEGVVIGLEAKFMQQNAFDFPQVDGGIELFQVDDVASDSFGIDRLLRVSGLGALILQSGHPAQDKAAGFIAHHRPLHSGLTTAPGRRFAKQDDRSDNLVIALSGIDKVQLNPSKRLLSRHRIAPFWVSKEKIGRL
jgi:hypothetical protein